MLALLALTGVLVGACFLLGQGVLALCGWREWRWWAPAVGYGVLLIWFGQLIRIPNHQRPALLVMVICVVAVLALPLVRRAVREAGAEALLGGAGLILLAAIPFFVIGHTGVLGAGFSDDMSQHLAGAYYLRTHAITIPVAAIGGNLINTGYPLGPHGLAAALTRASGLGEERAFSAITLAIPVLTAFAAVGIVPTARRAARWAFAAVIGLGYLPATYLAQGSFKETTQALLVLTTAVALLDLVRDESRLGWRRGIPVGLIAGAAVYNYSYGGVSWIVGVVAVFLVLEFFRALAPLATVRRWYRPAIGAIGVAAITVLPEIHRIERFRQSIFGREPLKNHGNLSHAVNPLETVGMWFSGDFRLNPSPEWPAVAMTVIALAVLVGSLVWWWRKRELALPAALIAAIAVWIELALTRNIYNAAKGLVVIAPLAMACIGAPLAAAWSARAASPRGRTGLRVLRVVGVVLLLGAAISTLGALRAAPVGLGPHEAELAALRPLVKGKDVLFLDNDNFAQWELRGVAHLYTTAPLYVPKHLKQYRPKLGYKWWAVDVDNYGSRRLDKVDFLLTPAGRYASEIPPNFHLVRRTPSYALYHRVGPTPSRRPLEEPGTPGIVFDCSQPRARRFLARFKWAGVLPAPIESREWQGTIDKPGETAVLHLNVPRGRWDVSLEYTSPTGATVRAPGLRYLLPVNYSANPGYWQGGTLTSSGGPLTLSVTAGQKPWFGRLLGSPGKVVGPLFPLVRNLALTRHATTPRRVLARKACGRYVDWFAPEGSKMRGRSGHDR